MPYASDSFPSPPEEQLQRIGPMGEVDPIAVYERTGRAHRELIEESMPEGWNWEGKRVLDFGCGVGRVIRQFAPEAEQAEFWGCDLDRPSIEWLQESLSPPFHFFESEEQASLPQKDGTFDLIYAFSVYTHFTDNWAGWLLEHHRVLKPGGLLFVTFLGPAMTKPLIDEQWDEDRIGMNVLLHGNPWKFGGPVAFNSSWWIRAHWGRAFEIVELRPEITNQPGGSHGCAVLRKKDVVLSEEGLRALEPDEPREIIALQHQVEQLRDETLRLRPAMEAQQDQIAQLEKHRQTLRDVSNSASWRLTAPLRQARKRLRRS